MFEVIMTCYRDRRETARGYCDDNLRPRVIEAYRNEGEPVIHLPAQAGHCR